MFRIGASLVFAVIAALVVMVSALLSGARYSIVALRIFTVFVLSGIIVYTLSFLFEKYAVPKLMGKNRAAGMEWVSNPETGIADAKEDGVEQETQQESSMTEDVPEKADGAETDGSGKAFVPLSGDGLEHVLPSQN